MAATRRQFVAQGLGYAAGASLFALGVGNTKADINAKTVSETKPARRESIVRMTPGQLAKIESVVAGMMERSAKDPRDPSGWLMNADPHREFCAAPGGSGFAQIHYCYWFLPWHRAYLAVLDRKLRALSGDPTLSFPYWNWSSTHRLPLALTQPDSSLSRAIRFTPNRPLRPDEIDYYKDDPVRSKLGVAALEASKFVANAILDRKDMAIELNNSFGGLIRPNAEQIYGNSRMENTPHGPIHVYVGGIDNVTRAGGDMTNFATAARDPAFFAHHGNLDRLWEIWRSNPANRAKEPTTSDFLEHTFTFPWLDGTSMQVTVAETLDVTKLGYVYDSLNVFETVTPVFEPEGPAQKLPPIVDTVVSLPPRPESTSEAPPRYLLVLEDIASPDRPMSAGVYVSTRGDAGSPSVLVGSISVVRSGDAFKPLDPVLLFDISAAVRILQTPNLRVLVVPNAIGGEAEQPYNPLRFKRATVILL